MIIALAEKIIFSIFVIINLVHVAEAVRCSCCGCSCYLEQFLRVTIDFSALNYALLLDCIIKESFSFFELRELLIEFLSLLY